MPTQVEECRHLQHSRLKDQKSRKPLASDVSAWLLTYFSYLLAYLVFLTYLFADSLTHFGAST